jgi:superfamily II DNA or RNA helicase
VWNESKFTIINFDILKTFGMGETKKPKEGEIVVPLNRDLVNAGFDLIIIDEAHYLKKRGIHSW